MTPVPEAIVTVLVMLVLAGGGVAFLVNVFMGTVD